MARHTARNRVVPYLRCPSTLAGSALLVAGLGAAFNPWSLARAQAGAAPVRLDTVVVTASRASQQLTDALPSSTVITRAEIEASQAPDVLSLLRLQAGIDIAQTGGPGAVAGLFMRGSNSGHTLLLIDGVVVNPVDGGGADWRNLMLEDVERIEIVRGNVSALYGSAAIGGVVQVFTRGGRGAPGASLRAQAGSRGNHALSLHAGGEWGAAGSVTRLAYTGSARSAAGWSTIDAGRIAAANPDIDVWRNQSQSVRLTRRFGEHELSLGGLSGRSHLDLDDPTDYSFLGPYNGRGHTHVENSWLNSGDARLRLQLNHAWESTVQWGETTNGGNTTASYPGSFLIDQTRSRNRQFSWQNSFALAPTQQLNAGLEHLSQYGTALAYPNAFNRRVASVLAGYTGQFGPHEAQLAVRNDRYSDFGGARTGLLAYGFRLTPAWKLIGQASTAFRAPSFNDLHFPFFGNPNLRPERARSVEAGVQYAAGNDVLRVSLYRNRIDDLIVFDPLINIANNIAAARIRGLETTATTRVGAWQLSGNLTVQSPVDANTGRMLTRRANHTLNLALARDWQGWRYAADVSRVGARYDTDMVTFGRINLPAYSLVNLRVARELNRNFTLGLALRNAFNARYQLADGFNTPGRVVLLTVDART